LQTEAEAFETPSGKGAADENFPVGSFLLPKRLRPHVAKFYAFARAIDDIADNNALRADDKLRRLDAFEDALYGRKAGEAGLEKAYAIRESCLATGVPLDHCRDLIAAFKQDAIKLRYDDWDDLMGYCFKSAAPVGRYLLDLHGEARDGWAASDALCNALQVLNHLQDCQDDYRNLDRVYLPGDWLRAERETVEALDRPASSPAMRRVLDRCIHATDALIVTARGLPVRLHSRGLAMESAVIVRLASRLSELLKRGDPLAGRVALTKMDFVRCGVGGAIAGLLK
jgi:hydroxysqualene synthase